MEVDFYEYSKKTYNELEKLGRISQIQSELRDAKQSISEFKEAINSSLNEPFKSFVWENLSNGYKNAQIKFLKLQLELKELKELN